MPDKTFVPPIKTPPAPKPIFPPPPIQQPVPPPSPQPIVQPQPAPVPSPNPIIVALTVLQIEEEIRRRRRANAKCPLSANQKTTNNYPKTEKKFCYHRRRPCPNQGKPTVTYTNRNWILGYLLVDDQTTSIIRDFPATKQVRDSEAFEKLIEEKEISKKGKDTIQFQRENGVEIYADSPDQALGYLRMYHRKYDKKEVYVDDTSFGERVAAMKPVPTTGKRGNPNSTRKFCLFRVNRVGKRRKCICPNGKRCQSTGYYLCPPSNEGSTITSRLNSGKVTTRPLPPWDVPDGDLGDVGNQIVYLDQNDLSKKNQSWLNLILKAPKGAPDDYEVKIRRQHFFYGNTHSYGKVDEVIINLTQNPTVIPNIPDPPEDGRSWSTVPVDHWGLRPVFLYRSKKLSGSDAWLPFPHSSSDEPPK